MNHKNSSSFRAHSLRFFCAMLVVGIFVGFGMINAHAEKKNSPTPTKTKLMQQVPWDLADKLGNAIIVAAKRPKQTQARFVSEVEALLSELIDFRVFARNVMGKYSKPEHTKSMPRKKRERLEQRTDKFSDTFKNQLIDIYSTTFWSVAKKASINTLPLTPSSKPGKQVIRQQVLGVSEKPVTIYYQMILVSGEWQIKNLAVQGIDLGKIYRNQFYNLMTEHNDDIDKVIGAWHVSS